MIIIWKSPIRKQSRMPKLYHIPLFLFGCFYYLIIPVIVVISKNWEAFPGMDNIYAYYKDKYLLDYFLLVLFIGISYVLGSYVPLLKINIKELPAVRFAFKSSSLFIASIPLLLYCQYLMVVNRGDLFQGYMIEVDAPFVGTIASATVFYLFLYLYNLNGVYSKTINYILILVLCELSFVLLGLGTRMYALIAFVALLVYLLDNNLISYKKLILWSGLGVVMLLFVGIWRMGDSDFTMEQLVYIGVAEPTFTWISAISMYDLNELPLFSLPYNFVSSFINFIPSALLPDKSSMLADFALKFDSPLGATNILLSLVSNFGVIGSLLAVFLLGFLISFVRLYWNSVFGQTYYYCICGVIPFQLFRDPLYVVNKEFFSNLIIVPAVIILVYKIYVTVFYRYR